MARVAQPNATAVTRAVSVTVAALLVGALVFAALTQRYRLERQAPAGSVTVVSELQPSAPPAPAAPVVRERPPPVRREAPVQEAPAAPPSEDASAAPGADPVVITAPVWVRRPRNPERYYPRDAFRQGVAGEVVLDCLVETSGALRCSIVSEVPEGWGFGEAAMAIASAHEMRPATRGGVAVEGRYAMTIPFSASSDR
ncbi:MAG: TonB family protein [Hyphomonadaceae bacterium]